MLSDLSNGMLFSLSKVIPRPRFFFNNLGPDAWLQNVASFDPNKYAKAMNCILNTRSCDPVGRLYSK